MESKNKKVIKNKDAIILISFIALIYFMIVYFICLNKSTAYAVSTETEIKTLISSAPKVNLEEIIRKNIENKYIQKFETIEIELEYITKYKNNSSLPKGTVQVIQEGRNGIQKIVTKKIYEGENLISEEDILNTITKASVDKIVEVGTAQYSSTYKPKKGDTLYVTSDRLSVMLENDIQSDKITTLQKNTEVKLLDISKEWYKISYNRNCRMG